MDHLYTGPLIPPHLSPLVIFNIHFSALVLDFGRKFQ